MNFIINKKRPFKLFTCHSGGATGADTYFEKIGELYGVKTLAYSYKTSYHEGKNKVEISEANYQEGIEKIKLASKTLKRKGFQKYLKLLSRNWQQIKNSEQVFAISKIIFDADTEYVLGGTGWAVQMAIDHQKEVCVFDQEKDAWFKWSYAKARFYVLKNAPKITKMNFAGIGIRKIKENGIRAIEELYKTSFIPAE